MNSTTENDKKSNIIIYILLIGIIISVLYIYYLLYKKQSDYVTNSDLRNSNYESKADLAANYESKADLLANYESKGDLSSLITTGSTADTIKIPATAGLLFYNPAYGYYSAIGIDQTLVMYVPSATSNITSTGCTYNASNKSFTNWTTLGVYHFTTVQSGMDSNTSATYTWSILYNGNSICNNSNNSGGGSIAIFQSSSLSCLVNITSSTDYIQVSTNCTNFGNGWLTYQFISL